MTKLDAILSKIESGRVKVGFPEGNTNPYPDGTSVIEVALHNEFGTSRMPERSFMRSTINENRDAYMDIMRKLMKSVLDGKRSVDDGLEMLGVQVQGDMQQKISDISQPPNSAQTIALKGSSNPLMDTDHMIQALTYEVVTDED